MNHISIRLMRGLGCLIILSVLPTTQALSRTERYKSLQDQIAIDHAEALVIEFTERVSVDSEGAQWLVPSENAQISDNGQFVVFRSDAANLFHFKTGADNPTGKEPLDDYWGDTFVHDRQTGETSLVSVNSEGERADNDSWDADISADGRFVVFALLPLTWESATNCKVAESVSTSMTGNQAKPIEFLRPLTEARKIMVRTVQVYPVTEIRSRFSLALQT